MTRWWRKARRRDAGGAAPDGHEVGTAGVEEFLAGAVSGQAAEQTCSQQALRAQRQGCEWTGDSAGLTRAIGERRVRLPRGANVYASRISTVTVGPPPIVADLVRVLGGELQAD